MRLVSLMITLALTSLVLSCGSTRESAGYDELERSKEPEATASTNAENAPEDPAAESPRAEAVAPPAPTTTDVPPVRYAAQQGDDLALWRDPSFRKRFTESYLAETDVEPTITVEERGKMSAIFDRIAVEDAAGARALLAEAQGPLTSAVFDFTIANLQFQAEELDAAAANYRIAVEKFPKFRRAWKNLGFIHVRQNDFAKAQIEFARVIELGGGDAVTYGLLGFCHANLENFLAAESAYRTANLLDPQTMDWKVGLIRSLFKQERFAEAATFCTALLAANPDQPDLWSLQANAYFGMGQPMKAAENFEMMDRLGSASGETLANLGDIYANQSLFDLAVDAYRRSMRKNPEGKAERPVRAAKFMSANGARAETRAMIEAIETAFGDRLSLDEKKDLLKMRSRLAVAEGSDGEEARVLEEIVTLDPLDGDALILLGQHHGRKGEVEKAIFYYERAEGIEAFEADAKVRHAQLLVSQGRSSEALPLLRRAQAVKPRDNVKDYLEQVERIAQGR